MGLNLHKKRFDEFTTQELYELLRIRTDVFVVEQNCVYQDMDYDGAWQGLWEADYAGRDSAHKNDLATIIRLTRGNDEDNFYISNQK